jgi:xanthine dehydrogenase large subunit
LAGSFPMNRLLADKEVHFCGMPILIIAAETEDAAEEAVHKIKIEIDPLPVITDPRVAFEEGKLLSASRQFKMGDMRMLRFKNCKYIFEGTAFSNGQEHLVPGNTGRLCNSCRT